MKFTVVWRPLSENHLAELWTNSPDRDEITKAADAIDYLWPGTP